MERGGHRGGRSGCGGRGGYKGKGIGDHGRGGRGGGGGGRRGRGGDYYDQRRQEPEPGSGSGSGGGRISGRNYRGRGRGPQRTNVVENSDRNQRSSPEPVADHVVPGVQPSRISNELPLAPSPSEFANTTSAVRRPDKGGTLQVHTCMLRVNHFQVKFNPESIIRHYDVDVRPEVLPKHGRFKINKSDLVMIRDKLFSDNPSDFPLSMTAYDGEKNIFSAVPLPTGRFQVHLEEGEDSRRRTYIFTIRLVNELKLRKLRDYIRGNVTTMPRDILQGMDVVVKENPARHMICTGRSFHSVEAHQNNDLKFGITASKGFQHSLRPTFQGLALCLDYSVLAFRKRLPVLEFLQEHIFNFKISNFKRCRKDVEVALKGVKVSVTHRLSRQKYVVHGLTEENTRSLTFSVEDPDGNTPPEEIHIVEYFRQKHKKEIVYKDIPCLDLGSNNRKNYVPMEFCVLVEGQIYPRENLDKNAALLLKNISLAKPWERKKAICHMVRARDGPCGGDTIKNFEMQVDPNMTSVVGRVIGPPDLKLSSPRGRVMKIKVDKEKFHWNFLNKGVVIGKSIERWAILDFTAFEKEHKLIHEHFCDKLIERCRKIGMHIEQPAHYETAKMYLFSDTERLRRVLEHIKDVAQKKTGGQLQILLCVMSRKDPGYKYLKWISETGVGIMTQCCLSEHANKADDQYLANLALKINAKLGGSNVELSDPLPYFQAQDHVMFVGADVNHPGSNSKTSPSISAVVATINWPAANRYAARIRPQDNRQEKIQHFGEICLELVETYARLNQVRPRSIVIFRDGVSEGQFGMVLQKELADLKRTFSLIEYDPRITLIVAQKRHHTRLFPGSKKDGVFTGNVFPGTVVDTTIVHPFEFDFYLCSHYGSLGTSKPTHYHVLWDEHEFTSDQLQELIYNMCFTFARCTKPVSLVPPVYYADLVAYRGRLYYEAVMDGSPASAMSSTSSLASSSLSSAASLDDRIYKLHADLENVMFFV